MSVCRYSYYVVSSKARLRYDGDGDGNSKRESRISYAYDGVGLQLMTTVSGRSAKRTDGRGRGRLRAGGGVPTYAGVCASSLSYSECVMNARRFCGEDEPGRGRAGMRMVRGLLGDGGGAGPSYVGIRGKSRMTCGVGVSGRNVGCYGE